MHHLLHYHTWPAAMAAAICLHPDQQHVPPGTPKAEVCQQISCGRLPSMSLIFCACASPKPLYTLAFPDDERDGRHLKAHLGLRAASGLASRPVLKRECPGRGLMMPARDGACGGFSLSFPAAPLSPAAGHSWSCCCFASACHGSADARVLGQELRNACQNSSLDCSLGQGFACIVLQH